MKNWGECESTVSDRKIVLRDKQSRNQACMIFNNPERKPVRKVLIDDCVIRDGLRCDYLLVSDSAEYFIELKGSDVKHAVSQIERSINVVSTDARRQPKHCLVISSRCPLFAPEIQEIKLRLKKEYNATFTVKNHQIECDL
jgi:hypothetical protein